MKHGIGFKAGAEPLGDETAMTMLVVVVISQSVVPVFVAFALLTSPIELRYFAASVVVYSVLLLCNVRDYRRVRLAEWQSFDPNFVFFETCLGSITAGLVILSVGADAPLYRQLLLIVMLTAAAIGNRAFVWGAWAFNVAVLAVVTWLGGTTGGAFVQVIVLNATAWAAVVAAFDTVVRRAQAAVGAKTSLGELAAQAGQAQRLDEAIPAAAPAVAAALDVDRATVLVQPRAANGLRELVTWPSPWPPPLADAVPIVAQDALAASKPTAGFVRRDGLAAIAAHAADVDLVLVVPAETTHRVLLDERATMVVASLLTAMADHVTHISGLVDRAATDELTGVANRRALVEKLPASCGRAARDEAALCLVMIDLDHFKSFNDSYGHLAGDRVLRQFAATLSERVRAQDLVARYGGEEFCIVLEKADLAGARTVIEAIASRPVSDGEGRGVTFSAGIAQWDGEEDTESLIRRADDALYRAKELGRNRTEVAS